VGPGEQRAGAVDVAVAVHDVSGAEHAIDVFLNEPIERTSEEVVFRVDVADEPEPHITNIGRVAGATHARSGLGPHEIRVSANASQPCAVEITFACVRDDVVVSLANADSLSPESGGLSPEA